MTNQEKAEIGIIGGSGLYQVEGLSDVREITVETPFGRPSDNLVLGTLEGVRVAFLARHGRGHRITPSELPFRANIYAMKMLGVERILSASAVGSLQEQYAPTDIVIPDQFFDRTRGRVSTFFGEGVVAHITFDHPVCAILGEQMAISGEEVGVKMHRGGTYLCMEGPAFSTLAESKLYRQWGMDVIGMTNLQEAKLAREAEICYATMALVTDYDCWHPDHSAVTVEMILAVLHQNAINAQQIVRHTVRRLQGLPRECKCGSSLRNAILTNRDLIPDATKQKLAAILGRYVGE